MTTLLRTAKSGSDWTNSDLDAYGIVLKNISSAEEFFEIPMLPPPDVCPELLTATTPSAVTDPIAYKIMRNMELARFSTQKTFVDQFSSALFEELGYVSHGRLVVVGYILPLLICGQNRSAETDVGIMTDEDILLLVQEDKPFRSDKDPVPQLMAEAIACFQNTNAKRLMSRNGRPVLEYKLIPGITMHGTSPTFFKIPVTAELSNAVAHGTYPSQPTVVEFHIPSLAEKHEGLWPVGNRDNILSCFQAFKKFLSDE